MRKHFVNIEFKDGVITQPLRVTFPIKRLAMKYCQAHGIDDEIEGNLAIAFYTTKEHGLTDAKSVDEFEKTILDLDVSTEEADPTQSQTQR